MLNNNPYHLRTSPSNFPYTYVKLPGTTNGQPVYEMFLSKQKWHKVKINLQQKIKIVHLDTFNDSVKRICFIFLPSENKPSSQDDQQLKNRNWKGSLYPNQQYSIGDIYYQVKWDDNAPVVHTFKITEINPTGKFTDMGLRITLHDIELETIGVGYRILQSELTLVDNFFKTRQEATTHFILQKLIQSSKSVAKLHSKLAGLAKTEQVSICESFIL